MPHCATRQNASMMMLLLILDAPCSRSTNVIGTSTIRRPAWATRSVRSIWKQYPVDSTWLRLIVRSVEAR